MITTKGSKTQKPNKPIIISEKNRGRIEAELQKIQGKAYVRKLTLEQIARAISDVEAKLSLPKTKLEGVRIDIDYHAANFPKNYRYFPMSTQARVVFDKKKWRIMYFTRTNCRRFGKNILIYLTPKAKNALIEKITNVAWPHY